MNKTVAGLESVDKSRHGEVGSCLWGVLPLGVRMLEEKERKRGGQEKSTKFNAKEGDSKDLQNKESSRLGDKCKQRRGQK